MIKHRHKFDTMLPGYQCKCGAKVHSDRPMTKHTPPTMKASIYAVVREIIEDYAGEDVLCDETDGMEYADEIEAIAANAHDDLMRACKMAGMALAEVALSNSKFSDQCQGALTFCVNAIEKAKVKP